MTRGYNMLLLQSEGCSMPEMRKTYYSPFGSDLAAHLTLRRPRMMYGGTGTL